MLVLRRLLGYVGFGFGANKSIEVSNDSKQTKQNTLNLNLKYTFWIVKAVLSKCKVFFCVLNQTDK